MLVLLDEGLHIDDTNANTTPEIRFTFDRFLLILRGWPLILRALVVILYLIKGFDALGGALDDRISHCLFHQVHFALSDKLHMSVCQRNQ